MWTIDVEDWIWGESPTPEKQLDAFKRGVEAGGDIVVLHFLYESTVGFLREMIRFVKGRERDGVAVRVGTVRECLGEKA